MVEDNTEGKSSQELEDMINNPSALDDNSETDKVEEAKEVKVEEVKIEEPTPVAEVTPAEEVQDKFSNKEKEDVIEMYENLEKDYTRKSQELAERNKETVEAPVSTTETTPAKDPLYELLFGQQPQDKVETPQVKAIVEDEEESHEPNRVAALEAKMQQGEKQLQYMLYQQLQQKERKIAIDKFETDSVLPFNAEVEQELETTIFKQLPQLKYQQGGYEYAYKLLKAEKTGALVKAAGEKAVAEALGKKGKNETAVVEAPGKAEPEPEIDLTTLNSKDLEAHINGLTTSEE